MKKIMQIFTASAVITVLLFASVLVTADYFTPDSYTVTKNGSLQWLSGAITVVRDSSEEVLAGTGSAYPKTYQGKLMLYNVIPLKTVQISEVDRSCVVLCGTPFGIKMFTDGVMVVGTSDLSTADGGVNPAVSAGLQVGDIITAIDGKIVETNSQVEEAVENCGGKQMQFTVRRDGTTLTVTILPVKSQPDGLYKIGVWVRDSTAGVGTLTYYDPSNGAFAGLGHGICDADTGEIMPLLEGEIVPVSISGVSKGEKGTPGELKGYFTSDTPMGTLCKNTVSGVFGFTSSAFEGQAIKVAMKQEINTGPVTILTTIDGETPQYYQAEIEKIDYRDDVQSKNMVIHITDASLISQTGGIVQGMSGSPVIQNGMLVGAVTHVFVNDPTRGYAVFAENMLTASQQISSTNSSENQKAS